MLDAWTHLATCRKRSTYVNMRCRKWMMAEWWKPLFSYFVVNLFPSSSRKIPSNEESFTRARANVVYAETKMNKAPLRYVQFSVWTSFWARHSCEQFASFCSCSLWFWDILSCFMRYCHDMSWYCKIFTIFYHLLPPRTTLLITTYELPPTTVHRVLTGEASSRSHAIFQLRISKRERVFEAAKTGQKVECTIARPWESNTTDIWLVVNGG